MIAGRPAAALALTMLVLTNSNPAAADPIRDAQWHLPFLAIERAHSLTEGNGVTVAVLDTGVDGNHPDLAGSLIPGTDLTGTGNSAGITDLVGHGTGMAGLIAAHGRALGIAPRSTIVSVRMSVASAGMAATATGLDWAIEHHVDVICIASGTSDNAALSAAVTRALAADIVVVAAAGNAPDAASVEFPAAYPGVIAAGGVDRNGNHASVSVTGPEVVLSAPAVDIVSTSRTGPGLSGYSTGVGTSDATAIIAGAAALVRSKFPNLSGPEVVHRLTATADDKGPPGRDVEYGFGVVNIVKALTADVPPLTTAPTAVPTTTTAQANPPLEEDSNLPLIIAGGLLLALLLAGGGAWMVMRARR